MKAKTRRDEFLELMDRVYDLFSKALKSDYKIVQLGLAEIPDDPELRPYQVIPISVSCPMDFPFENTEGRFFTLFYEPITRVLKEKHGIEKGRELIIREMPMIWEDPTAMRQRRFSMYTWLDIYANPFFD